MENVISALEANLKDLYRKAVDADLYIDQLKKQGHGKFNAIFADNSAFQTTSNKFMPYLEETAELILQFKETAPVGTEAEATINNIVQQLHLLHSTLAEFKSVVKEA